MDRVPNKQLAQSCVKEAGTLTTNQHHCQRRSSNQLAPVMGKKQTITKNSQFWHLKNHLHVNTFNRNCFRERYLSRLT